ncbi:hypothetical protein [Metabacillus iocasae]|uniref:Uncharacterized protein n=1 Tax=Priestia iocasae TaxID=2291674 RepID=A0ABS2QZQ2_9BACI|nr:hypothetical protein [Metabacillus iocasae]MBM7703939.1 hypothetical protein [Metabacillus iocasae]
MIVFLVVIIGFLLLYNNREEEELYLVPKLIVYYLLGSFTFSFNSFILPIGFIISLFLRSSTNQNVKRVAAIFGLLMMLATTFLY